MDHKEYSTVDVNNAAAPEYERKGSVVENRKETALGEAAEIFGDVQTAEQYGYVERGLKSRHIQFIALGGTIGYVSSVPTVR